MLILQRTEIEQLVNMEACFKAIERAYIASSEGRINLPPVGHITFLEQNADCHIKYGHIEGDDTFAIKIATGFPSNAKSGLANGNGVVLVLSALTGEVKAVLHDEMYLTDVRTGIGGAIASHALARQEATKVLIIGTGIQARMQIEAHAIRFDQELEFLIWGRSPAKVHKVCDELCEDYNVTLVENLKEACGTADIIVTTTAATEPLIKSDWITSGTHITAIGADAPGKQELETELIARAGIIVVDSKSQCIDHGEIAKAIKEKLVDYTSIQELGTILTRPSLTRTSDNQITIADLTGIAAQDIAITGVMMSSIDK